jgi:hypothetical protein
VQALEDATLRPADLLIAAAAATLLCSSCGASLASRAAARPTGPTADPVATDPHAVRPARSAAPIDPAAGYPAGSSTAVAVAASDLPNTLAGLDAQLSRLDTDLARGAGER